MKAAKKKQQQEAHHHLLQASPRHDKRTAEAADVMPTKGCATFWVGEEWEDRQRFSVPVARLGHPRILGLLAEAEEEYGFTQAGAIVVPCSIERFRKAADAVTGGDSHHGRHHHHHHHFHLPHLVGCFRA